MILYEYRLDPMKWAGVFHFASPLDLCSRWRKWDKFGSWAACVACQLACDACHGLPCGDPGGGRLLLPRLLEESS